MDLANGDHMPPAQSPASPSPSPVKRKRPEIDNVSNINGASLSPAKMDTDSTRPLQTVLEDIVEVLKNYDIQPSILSRPITTVSARAASGESESKRAKCTPTIASLVQDSSYSSLEAFENDVETATSDALSSLEISDISVVHPSEQAKLQTKVLAFQKMAKTLISREEARRPRNAAQPVNEKANDDSKPADIKEEDVPESRTVLTLYGTAQGPKQLFSSLQQHVSVTPPQEKTIAGLDTSVKVTMPLRESALPNFISTTQVFPLPEDSGKKSNKTFGEVFPAPPHLQPLSQPKLLKPQSGKGNVITFVPQESLPEPYIKSSQNYTTQGLSTGHWLGYGGVDMPKDPTSPTAKQKSRQRALSTGEAQLPPSEATLAAVQQAKEDALFRSVYSSFAPSRDDATAIVPEETKNKVWWQKVGEKRFNDTFPIDPDLLALDRPAEVTENGAVDDAESLKELIENFTPPDPNPFESLEKSELEKDTNELLQEISELLETLASHQRIRNSSLARNPRTPVIQNATLASLAGSPSSPSSEEIDVYEILKSQLALMVSQLPPYAVAKLNGDQLDELNISRTLIIETEDHKGVLEEDQLSRRSAAPVASGVPPSLSRMASAGTSVTTHYGSSNNQYGRNTPSMHSSAVRIAQPAQSYLPQQPSMHRSPSVHYQRSSSGPTQSYQTPAPAYNNNTTPRHNYNPSQYSQQTPRPAYAQATPSQYFPQRPAAPASNYGNSAPQQYYQSTPQAQSHRYAPQPAQNGFYQQRPQNNPSYNYNAPATPLARTESPMKTNPAVAQPGHSSRPNYATPVVNNTMRNTFYPPGAPATPQYGTPQAHTPSTTAPSGYPAVGPNHQQLMLERQQAQIAAQSQARITAQNNFHRHGSGTPQPPAPQYGNGQPPPNGAPMVA